MKIYTKTGDRGETSILGGKRVPKDSLRIETYGTIDELNSSIGVCRSFNSVKEIDIILKEIQRDLFALGTELVSSLESKKKSKLHPSILAIKRMEQVIDELEPKLIPLKNFILPCGSQVAAMLHLARTICRRAERFVVRLSREEEVSSHPTIYLNRLSDFLFVLARWTNELSNTPEERWKSR